MTDAERALLRQDELKWLDDSIQHTPAGADVPLIILRSRTAELLRRLAAARAGERETLEKACDGDVLGDVLDAPREVVLQTLKAAREQLLMAHEDMNHLRITRGERWIPVTERLPEDGTTAIIFVPGWDDAYLLNRVAWIDYDVEPPQWISNGEVVESVTDWRSLPSPPAESETK